MAIKHILIAIDGTGSREWIRKNDGFNSHVYRFYQDFLGVDIRHKCYLHGPGNTGLDVGSILNEATEKVYEMIGYARQDGAFSLENIKVNIVGHSRGAFIALRVANMLENPNEFLRITQQGSSQRVDLLTRTTGTALPRVRVNFIGLYDTVKRSATEFMGDMNFRNVDLIAHAIRPRGRSRLSFSGVDIPGNAPISFDTSHGGVGGDPGFFGSLNIVTEDPYCNARHLVGDVDNINIFNWAYGTYWGATQNTIEDIKRFWVNSSLADSYIRENAILKQVPLKVPSPHYPYVNDILGKKLKNLTQD